MHRTSQAEMANMLAMLANSARHLAHQSAKERTEIALRWRNISENAIQQAKERLQQSYKPEIFGPRQARYKDIVMALSAMLGFAVIYDRQQDARACMIDTERLLRPPEPCQGDDLEESTLRVWSGTIYISSYTGSARHGSALSLKPLGWRHHGQPEWKQKETKYGACGVTRTKKATIGEHDMLFRCHKQTYACRGAQQPDGFGATTSAGNEAPSSYMVRALSSALVIFYYRRIRNVHPLILEEHVKNVVQALQDLETSCESFQINGPGSPWPVFMAGCEAIAQIHRDYLLQLLNRAFLQTGFDGFKTIRSCL